METVEIDGVSLALTRPDELELAWVGQASVRDQLVAAWMILDPQDQPMSPRILGRPGVGKTALAYATAKALGLSVWLVQATMDTRPEDLLVTPVLSDQGSLRYVASGLVTAMLKGGVCILDEGNRMTEKAWASLAPLLDNRRYVESLAAGLKIKAHPNFRFVATMNEDASTFEIPEYIHSRLQPQIRLDFPSRQEELAILEANLEFASEDLLAYVADFLQRAHRADERYSVRDGINIARYALKLLKRLEDPECPELPVPPRRVAEVSPKASRALHRQSDLDVDSWFRSALEGVFGGSLKELDERSEGESEDPRPSLPLGVLSLSDRKAKDKEAPAQVPDSGSKEAAGRSTPKSPRVLPRSSSLSSEQERALALATEQILGEEALGYLPE